MHDYLIKISNLLSDLKKKSKRKSKTEVQLVNSKKNAKTVENFPETEVLDLPEYQDPAIIDSMISFMSRKSWTLIVPSEASLKKIAEKNGLEFHNYIYRNSEGIGNLSLARYVLLHNVVPDGNCGYRALSYGITGSDRYWMTTIDLFAASIMLEINILVRDTHHEWQLYNSSIQNGFSNMQVDLSLPTILMDNSSRDHFQAITAVRRF